MVSIAGAFNDSNTRFPHANIVAWRCRRSIWRREAQCLARAQNRFVHRLGQAFEQAAAARCLHAPLPPDLGRVRSARAFCVTNQCIAFFEAGLIEATGIENHPSLSACASVLPATKGAQFERQRRGPDVPLVRVRRGAQRIGATRFARAENRSSPSGLRSGSEIFKRAP